MNENQEKESPVENSISNPLEEAVKKLEAKVDIIDKRFERLVQEQREKETKENIEKFLASNPAGFQFRAGFLKKGSTFNSAAIWIKTVNKQKTKFEYYAVDFVSAIFSNMRIIVRAHKCDELNKILIRIYREEECGEIVEYYTYDGESVVKLKYTPESLLEEFAILVNTIKEFNIEKRVQRLLKKVKKSYVNHDTLITARKFYYSDFSKNTADAVYLDDEEGNKYGNAKIVIPEHMKP